jgi:hypothetical protein
MMWSARWATCENCNSFGRPNAFTEDRMSTLMQQADGWYDDAILTKFLAGQLRRGRIAIILGSGISTPFGLPDWKALLIELFRRGAEEAKAAGTLEVDRPDDFTFAKQAEIFKLSVCERDEKRYRAAIRQALYKNVDADFWTMRPTLAAVGALVMASRRGSASHVVTFNFDDILELYLEFHGFVVESVTASEHWAVRADVAVYHPHGFLPLDQTRKASEELVFDQHAFSEALHGEGGRLWRQELIGIFRTHTCLLIGIGEDDPNLESLMHEVQKEHISRSSHAFWGVRLTGNGDSNRRKLWEERGIANVPVADFERDLPRRLLAICQLAARID